jgi:hypothetical protein
MSNSGFPIIKDDNIYCQTISIKSEDTEKVYSIERWPFSHKDIEYGFVFYVWVDKVLHIYGKFSSDPNDFIDRMLEPFENKIIKITSPEVEFFNKEKLSEIERKHNDTITTEDKTQIASE